MSSLGLALNVALLLSFIVSQASAKTTTPTLMAEMDKILAPLNTQTGREKFLAGHPGLCGNVDNSKSFSSVGVETLTVKIEGNDENFGLSCRTVYISAPPQKVIEVVDNPSLFQSLYGLDKKAELSGKTPEGIYEARVFKLVPGVETQDYILKYTPHWEDKTWIERATQVSDSHDFALRDNIKTVESFGQGTLHREISLFFPRRWWMKMKFVNGFVQKVTKSELTKINMSLKCATEKLEATGLVSDLIAKACHKDAER